jgi:hypothetical protein
MSGPLLFGPPQLSVLCAATLPDARLSTEHHRYTYGMEPRRSDGRQVLASFASWDDFARSLDRVELSPPRDNYGETQTPATAARVASSPVAGVEGDSPTR